MQLKTGLTTTMALLLLALVGCDQDQRGQRSPAHATSSLGDLAPGDAGHADVSQQLAAGQVRAGAVTAASQLLAGPHPAGQVGDIKIYNDRVAFIISGARTTDGQAPFGGEIADATRLADGTGQSLLGELVLAVGIHVIRPTSVGVVNDGDDGEPALVRVIGRPAAIPALDSLLGPMLGSLPDVELVLDYSLEPNAEALGVRLRVRNHTSKPAELPMLLVNMPAGDGVEPFVEQRGFDAAWAPGADFVATVGAELGYVLYSPQARLDPLVSMEGLAVSAADMFTVPADTEQSRQLQLAVAPADPEGLRRSLRALRGLPPLQPTLMTVVDQAGTAVSGARVHVQEVQDGAYVTMARSDADGRLELRLPDGAYRATLVAPGRAVVAGVPLEVPAPLSAPDELAVALGGQGTLTYRVNDAQGRPLPCKLTLVPAAAWPELPDSFGPPSVSGETPPVVRSASGTGAIALPPGTYRVVASRGFEYEIDTRQVTLEQGAQASVTLQLQRSVDTTGLLCGDFHMHGAWSPDSSDTYEQKVTALAAAGVELGVITEHDYVGDMAPAATAAALDQWVRTVVGLEITTFTLGHFNVFPLRVLEGERNAGAPESSIRPLSQLLAKVKARWPAALVQVNHPRAPSIGGFFSAMGLDPDSGQPTKQPEQWSSDFETVEIFNAKRLQLDDVWSNETVAAARDWFALLNRGRRVTATGGSDSHDLTRFEPGYPRNCVQVADDSPATMDLQRVMDAIRAQQLVVSGGPMVQLTVGGRGLGQLATPPPGGEPWLAHIKVQAPRWMPVDTLRVFLGGQQVQTITLPSYRGPRATSVVRFDGEVELAPTEDSWVVVLVTGQDTLAPVNPGAQPFALTNPVYLDVNGNGRYDPAR